MSLSLSCHGTVMEGSRGSKSESFTRALQKFSSLSSSDIRINLPAMSLLQTPPETTCKPANPKTKTKKELDTGKEKKFATTSTQTVEEDWGDSPYCYDGHLLVLPPPPHHTGLQYYNTTRYSRDCHLYSTLV